MAPTWAVPGLFLHRENMLTFLLGIKNYIFDTFKWEIVLLKILILF